MLLRGWLLVVDVDVARECALVGGWLAGVAIGGGWLAVRWFGGVGVVGRMGLCG